MSPVLASASPLVKRGEGNPGFLSGPCPFGCRQAGVRNGLIVSPDQPYLVCDLQASRFVASETAPKQPKTFSFGKPRAQSFRNS